MVKAQASAKKVVPKRPVRELDEDEEAPVIVFDQTKFGIKERKGIAGSRRTTSSALLATATGVVEENAYADADDVADMEVGQIWEQLKTSVEDIHASTLRGRERKKYQVEKAVKLGAKPLKKQQHPKDMRIGIVLKARERAKQEREKAREMDVILAKKTGPSSTRSKSKGSNRRK